MLRVCQSIRTSSLPDRENQAIFAARSPTAIRNIRPLSLRPKQIPETSRSGTWTTRRTRSRFLFDLRFLPSERVSAGMKGHYDHCLTISRVFAERRTAFHPEPTSGAGTKRDVWRPRRSKGDLVCCAAVGCGHVSGLRYAVFGPLALMQFAAWLPNRFTRWNGA